MSNSRVFPLLVLAILIAGASSAQAQLPAAASIQPPQTSALAAVMRTHRWLQLTPPFSQPLRITFDARPTPTFEMLRLPTYEGRAYLLEQGRLAVSLFEKNVPALELDCASTCVPLLEQSLGVEARYSLGRVSSRIPDTFVSTRTEAVRMQRGFYSRSIIGVGGLLDF